MRIITTAIQPPAIKAEIRAFVPAIIALTAAMVALTVAFVASAVAFAVAFSTMIAYTLTPMLSAYWLKLPYAVGTEVNPRNKYVQIVLDKFENGFQITRQFYSELMEAAANYPKKIILISSMTLLFNLALVPFLGVELQPTYDSGQFSVSFKAPTGTNIEKTKELVEPLEAEIGDLKEVQIVSMRLGGTRTPPSRLV